MTKKPKSLTRRIDQKVQSWAIDRVEYFPDREILHLYMQDESILEYSNVPVEVYKGLMDAESKGRYFNFNIRNNYKYTRLG